MEAPKLMCFFSAPQGSWQKVTGTFELGELTNRVEITLEHGTKPIKREGHVQIPSDFIRFYSEVLKPTEAEWEQAYFRVVQDGDRYYFLLTYTEPQLEGECTIPLWYWVPSNLPKWVKKAPLVKQAKRKN